MQQNAQLELAAKHTYFRMLIMFGFKKASQMNKGTNLTDNAKSKV